MAQKLQEANKVIVRLSCLVPFLFLVGCAGMMKGSFIPVEEEQSRQVLEALRQKEHAISTLRGLFRASISGTGVPFSQNLNGTFSYAQPDVLHMRGFLRLGVPVMDFRRQGNAYELYFPAERKMIVGDVNAVQDRTQWDQTVLLSLRAFDGVLGKVAGLSSSDVRVWKSENQYRLDIDMAESPSGSVPEEVTVRTWIDAQTLELMSIEYLQFSDELIVSVECGEYRDVRDKGSREAPSVRLPFVVHATDHRARGGSITLKFQELIMNAA